MLTVDSLPKEWVAKLRPVVGLQQDRYDGEDWLPPAVNMANHLEKLWGLETLRGDRTLTGGVLSLCILTHLPPDSRYMVLKIGSNVRISQQENEALRIWQKSGRTPTLIKVSTSGKLMTYVESNPAKVPALSEITNTLTKIHSVPVITRDRDRFPKLVDNLKQRIVWAREDSYVPQEVIQTAGESLLRLGTALGAKTVLLHGDYQNKNLLTNNNDEVWVLDPLPCVGDYLYDYAVFASTGDMYHSMDEILAHYKTILPQQDFEKVLLYIKALSVLEYNPKHRELGRAAFIRQQYAEYAPKHNGGNK